MHYNLHANIKEKMLPKSIRYNLPSHYSEVVNALFTSGIFKNSDQDEYFIDIGKLPVVSISDPEMAIYNYAIIKATSDNNGSPFVAIVAALKRVPDVLDDISCISLISDMYYQFKHTHASSGIVRHH